MSTRQCTKCGFDSVPEQFCPECGADIGAISATELPNGAIQRTKSVKYLILVALIIVIAGLPALVYGFNYLTLQKQVSEVLGGDPRNAGVVVSVHYGYYLSPSALEYDLKDVP